MRAGNERARRCRQRSRGRFPATLRRRGSTEEGTVDDLVTARCEAREPGARLRRWRCSDRSRRCSNRQDPPRRRPRPGRVVCRGDRRPSRRPEGAGTPRRQAGCAPCSRPEGRSPRRRARGESARAAEGRPDRLGDDERLAGDEALRSQGPDRVLCRQRSGRSRPRPQLCHARREHDRRLLAGLRPDCEAAAAPEGDRSRSQPRRDAVRPRQRSRAAPSRWREMQRRSSASSTSRARSAASAS